MFNRYSLNNLRLCKAQTNAMNLYIVEMIRAPYHAILVDWDLSDAEEEKLISTFQAGKLDYEANGSKWDKHENVYNGAFARQILVL